MIGEVVLLEDDTATLMFKTFGTSTVIKPKEFPALEQYLVPRMSVVYHPESNTLEVPIIKWRDQQSIKLLMYT
jgi:hypothetical protein